MNQAKSYLPLLFAAVILSIVPGAVLAQNAVPMLITYQGELRSPSTGEPIGDGSYEVLFRIYDAEFGGTPLWVGTHSSLNGNPLEVTDGLFNVVLGSGTGNAIDPSLFNGADRWLEVRVGMETLEPRQRITSAAYAIVSEDSRLLGGKEASEFASATHAHAGEEITSGIVAEERIDASIARDSEVLGVVLAGDGSGSTLDADTLDGVDSGEFASSTHAHAGEEITSGIVAEERIDASIARDSEVLGVVLAGDGSGSTLDADMLDGKDSGEFASATHAHSFADVTGSATDAQVPDNITVDHAASAEDADTVDGLQGADLEESAEIDADIASHAAASDAHHARYDDAEAVAAMGTKGDGNPLNHDKATALPWNNITSKPAGFADDLDNDTTYAAGTGIDLAGGVFSADFAGSGSAGTVSRSDHGHDAAYVNEGQTDSVTSAMVVDGTLASTDLGNNSVITSTILNNAVTTEKIANDAVTSQKISDGTIRDMDISDVADIAGTKIDPDFGSQNVLTTGRLGVGTTSPTAKLQVVTDVGANSILLNQGDVVTDNQSTSTSRYVVSIAGTWYWGVGKTHTGNNNFHIINYPSSRWDFTVRNDTGYVGIGTTSPQAKLDVNGDANVAGNLTVNGVSMGKIDLTTDGTILSTDQGRKELYWDKVAAEIQITNTSPDWCDYWWQAQKGTTTTGNSGAIPAGASNVAIITTTNTNDYGYEVHFGQADGTAGWCSVWLQYANGRLVGHYLMY